VATGDLMALRTGVHFGGIRAINNFGFVSLTDDDTWMGRVADVWIESVAPFFVAPLSSDCEHDQLEIHSVYPDDFTVVFRDDLGSVPGGLTGAPVPGQVAAKITWYVDGSHRSQRGRSYIWGVPNDNIVGARRLDGDLDTLLRAFADTMLATWGPGGTESTAQFVILSRQLDNAPRAHPVGNPVIEYNVPNILGSQRGRLL